MGKDKQEKKKNTENIENIGNIGNPFAQLKTENFPDQKLDGKFNNNTSYKIKKAKVPISSTKDISTNDESSLFFANMLSVQKLNSSPKDNKKNKSHKTEQSKKQTKDYSEQKSDTLCGQNNIQKPHDKHTDFKKLISQNMDFTTEQKIEKASNIKGDTVNTYNPFEVSQTFSEALSSQYKNTVIEKKPTPSSLNKIESKNKIKTIPASIDKNATKPNDISDDINNNDDDLSLFFTEVSNVKNLQGKGREITPEIIPTHIPSPPVPVVNPLQAFMDEKLQFALHSTEDYVEAHVIGLDLMTLGKLQARQYTTEAHIDLHGLSAEQAYTNLVAFFKNSYQRGLRSVLVVTGKGNNSINGIPILRNSVQEWFTKNPFKQVILAFCSAKIEDGGSGALYVLIRKQKKDYGTIQWDIKQADPDFFL